MRERIWRLVSTREDCLSWFNGIVIVLIVASLALLAAETEPTLPEGAHRWIAVANVAILILFALEYALRVWAAGADPRWRGALGRLRFAAQVPLLGDLLAFGPELVVILLFPEAAREAGFLRALRLIRVVRLLAYFPAVARVRRAVAGAAPQLATGLGLAVMTIFVAACVLYFAEGAAQPQTFGSIPRALWWAVTTLTTVGYGDAVPMTVAGKIAAGIAALGGVGMVALPTGVLAGAFAAEFRRPPPPPSLDKGEG